MFSSSSLFKKLSLRFSVLCFIFCRPLPLSVGFLAQYVLKPALGVLIARAFGMSSMFFAGFVLTCCVSGAQLSSYASFLSKGDVALSILLTSSTTIASVIVTPLLTGLLIGSVVPVDAVAMSKSILQVWCLRKIASIFPFGFCILLPILYLLINFLVFYFNRSFLFQSCLALCLTLTQNLLWMSFDQWCPLLPWFVLHCA